jgi:hypothetical protein
VLLRRVAEPGGCLSRWDASQGAWTASAGRLTELIADYKLTGDLAFTYGRIEGLRWRLRHRTESQNPQLDATTSPLVGELNDEVRDLLKRIGTQLANPDVQPFGLVHTLTGSIGGRASVTADLSVICADGSVE